MSDIQKPARVRITTKGFESFTGLISIYPFVDGVSVDPIAWAEINRLSAAFQLAEILEDGTEIEAGAAARIVNCARDEAPVVPPLTRASEEDLIAEALEAGKAALKLPDRVRTREQLEHVLKAEGVNGIRKIAEKWGVKHSSIVTLIDMILQAQDLAKSKLNATVAKIAGTDYVTEDAPVEEFEAFQARQNQKSERSPKKSAPKTAAQVAAERGDMTTAINTTNKVV